MSQKTDQKNGPKTGREYWRSLDQLADTPEFRNFLHREFPEHASELTDDVSRRKFLVLMSAALGMAGLAACRRPVEKILPVSRANEPIVPGVPLMFATVMNFAGQAQGLLVRSNDGRPTKVEGNPLHPASLGSTSGFAQAAILNLYDPDRARSVMQGGQRKSWKDFTDFASKHFADLRARQGEGLRILAESDSSPSLRELRDHVLKTFPQARWHVYDAVSHDNVSAGAQLAFGQIVHAHYAFDRADVVVALDSDFLGLDPQSTVNVKQFAKKRRTGTEVEHQGSHDAHGAQQPSAGEQQSASQQSHEGAQGAGGRAAEPREQDTVRQAERSNLNPPSATPTPAQTTPAGDAGLSAAQRHGGQSVPAAPGGGAPQGAQGGADSGKMNRLYAVESNFTVTGAMADHRLRLQSARVGGFLAALAGKLGVAVGGLDKSLRAVANDPRVDKWAAAIAKDMQANRGRSVVVVGARQPAAVHALAHVINGSFGGEVTRYTPAFSDKFESGVESLRALAADIDGGRVNTLVVLGGNPVYAAPADLNFGEKLGKVQHSIYLGTHEDETAASSKWLVNEAHFLEAWGDGRAWDGTASIQQPLIAPLHDGRSAIELLAFISDYPQKSGYEIVRALWQRQMTGGDFEKAWARALHDGVIANTAFAEVRPAANAGAVGGALEALPEFKEGIEVNFVPDSSVYDGRFANNAWLQEAPDPMTKLVWDNAALMSKDTAERLGVGTGDLVKLNFNGANLDLPVFILPGHAKDSITVPLGYGRGRAGRVGTGVGFNAYKARTSGVQDFVVGASVMKTGGKYDLATTQDHWSMEGRPVVREASLADFQAKPAFAKQETHVFSIYEEPYNYSTGQQWGMAIDLNTCVGCNACVVACQSENNVPVVGKDQVMRGREMHWLRMDRYFTNIPETEFGPGGGRQRGFDEDRMEAVQQVMLCQHCENAPCETVCPVAATVHSEDGLNTMAYNRCVGTRYCSNNCPYKVRRFNFLNWHRDISETEKMAQNPDVTVRMRGVMEKCTFCVQRIQAAKITAKADGRRAVRDGEVTTACAQACPADAIVFGDINDPNSQVSRMRKQAREYKLLEELNVKPRTSYLAKVRNLNQELA
jgi:MoCo/4Fe-4S cofactor protein with predicted Tat translocation signal